MYKVDNTSVDYNTVVSNVNTAITESEASTSNMPTYKLVASGYEMPVVAYGTLFRSTPY